MTQSYCTMHLIIQVLFPSQLIPHCIGTHLTHLQYLDLSSNSLTGSIPASFSNLYSLQFLDLSGLSHNLLYGLLPSSLFHHVTQLSHLYLDSNSFSGLLPSSLFTQLTNLTHLDLNFNSFSGSLNVPFNLCHLSYLDLSHNLLFGNITQLFGSQFNLPSLGYLDLSYNTLSGEIPTLLQFLHFPSLWMLDLSQNSLSGGFPPSLCGIRNLIHLHLSNNALSGWVHNSSLQHCGTKMVNLFSLDLSDNNFTGPFPSWVASLSELFNLDLSHNSFTGSLPYQLACPSIAAVFLSHNQFTGPFPAWIGSNMSDLDLSYNKLKGSFPNYNPQNVSLVSLDLSGNSLDDDTEPPVLLPRWLFKSPSLSYLKLRSMRIKPANLGADCSSQQPLMSSSSIEELDLSSNNLTADSLSCLFSSQPRSLTASLQLNLSSNPLAVSLMHPNVMNLVSGGMSSLDLSFCQLKGRLSGNFFEKLQVLVDNWRLFMAGNFLYGEIPAQLGNCSHLEQLDLSNNLLTGLAPFRYSTLTSLSRLQLSNNELTGTLSLFLSSLLQLNSTSVLANLDLSNNLLQGSIPANLLRSCVELTRLKLNGNLLEGIIPLDKMLQNSSLPNLEILSLGYNHLTGEIPSSIKEHKSLVLLDLSHNKLEGNLEMDLFGNESHTMPKLRVLLLGFNLFTGSIPTSLGRSTPSLQVIDISNNHLSGQIPPTLQELNAFKVISFTSANILTMEYGTLYEEFELQMKGNTLEYKYVLNVLITLDVSGNNLSGPIPTGLGALSGLISLNISRNSLSGFIPSDLGQLTQLQSLDLSFNNLTGQIPQSFENLKALEVFNVSFNKGLRGPILTNQPQLEDYQSYLGDSYLCGEPTLHSCTPPPIHNSERGTNLRPASGLVKSFIDEWISIPGFLLGLVTGFGGILWLMKLIQ